MINLINFGLTRETAKDIHEKLDSKIKVPTSSSLLKLFNEGKLESIHAVSKNELKELFS